MRGSLIIGFLLSPWPGKRSRRSRRMRSPQFYVSCKGPIAALFAHVVPEVIVEHLRWLDLGRRLSYISSVPGENTKQLDTIYFNRNLLDYFINSAPSEHLPFKPSLRCGLSGNIPM